MKLEKNRLIRISPDGKEDKKVSENTGLPIKQKYFYYQNGLTLYRLSKKALVNMSILSEIVLYQF